jgi:penicillin-binding protein 2
VAFYVLGGLIALGLLLFLGKLANLQIARGEALAARSINNSLRQTPIFAERGLVLDRNDVELAWNDPAAGRRYITTPGFGHLLGYIGYPTEKELAAKKYDPKELVGREGLEQAENGTLEGKRGLKIEETDVTGAVVSEHLLEEPTHGESVTTSIDSRLQAELYDRIKALVTEGRFKAGAGVIMDVRTGELLAMTSAPEFDPNLFSSGKDAAAIKTTLTDPSQPFLNRALEGLYTPGSIVKPIMALGALNEGVVVPNRVIHSSGEIRLANPYDPGTYSVFRDWKALGDLDLRHAIAMSSDVYFYSIGGGFGDQKGMGIAAIDKYAHLFGLDQPTGIDFLTEAVGTIPTPEWKAEHFDGEPWRVGDTYHTVIGQYGFQITPLEAVRAIGAIATNGTLVQPSLLKGATPAIQTITGIKPEYYQVVHEGMRLSATEGVAAGLNLPDLAVAAKTGTAELGVSKANVNSWVVGFFPYDEPRYAFAVVLERGSRTNTIGGVYVMRQVFDWMLQNTPEYTH